MAVKIHCVLGHPDTGTDFHRRIDFNHLLFHRVAGTQARGRRRYDDQSCTLRHPLDHVGGLVAGALFEGTKFGFAFYVTHVANYERLYGALSTLPIFLIWLYLIWVIVLIGSEITFCLQHPEQSHRRHSNYLRPGVKQFYAHLILLRAAQALKQGDSLSMAQLINETGIPENIMQEWLDNLCSLGLLHSTTGSSAVQSTWVLAQAADQLSLLKIFETLNQVPMKIPETCADTPLGRRLQGLYYRLDRQSAKLMQQITLRDLLEKEAEEQDTDDKH